MKTLLQFLARYSILLLFLLLETVAFILIVRHNRYQQSAVFSSANRVSAGIYQMSSSVAGYFNLKQQNDALTAENEALLNRVSTLENRLEKYEEDSATAYVFADRDISFTAAKVINSSTDQQRNYLTLNKGSRDGLYPDMGVVCQDGVVGIVSAVSERFAVVIPVLNPLLSISCKFKKNGYPGSLQWSGRDYRYAELKDVARHIQVEEGDTIVTSGLSEVFAESMPVGIVDKAELTESDAYYRIRVRLGVDFKNLRYVSVMENKTAKERRQLQQEAFK